MLKLHSPELRMDRYEIVGVVVALLLELPLSDDERRAIALELLKGRGGAVSSPGNVDA